MGLSAKEAFLKKDAQKVFVEIVQVVKNYFKFVNSHKIHSIFFGLVIE